MDRFPVKVITVAEDRSCGKCHNSWIFRSSHKNVKEGVGDDRMYCCAVGARLKMEDGVYPQLTAVVRERKDLCGSTGKWFVLAQDIPLGPLDRPNRARPQEAPSTTTRRENAAKPQYIRRPREVATPVPSSSSPAPRKPYKVN